MIDMIWNTNVLQNAEFFFFKSSRFIMLRYLIGITHITVPSMVTAFRVRLLSMDPQPQIMISILALSPLPTGTTRPLMSGPGVQPTVLLRHLVITFSLMGPKSPRLGASMLKQR